MAIINVVEWNPAPNVFAWRFPNSELNTKAQLIVSEGQEAFLFNSGQAIGPFAPGRHVLDTSNYPVLKSLVKVVTGGVSPFRAEVWFISKAFKLNIKWGTSGAISVEDPKYHIMLPIRGFGQYGLVVEDSRKFLLKMIGMVPAFTDGVLTDYFRGVVVTYAKDVIAKSLIDKGISVLQISSRLAELSEAVEAQISEKLSDYGVRIVNFTINSISTDEQDPAVVQLRNALSKKAEMDIIGYNYQQERSFDTLQTAAGNSGSGNVMSAGMGMGMGMGMSVPMGNMMGNMMGNVNVQSAPEKKCPKCNSSIPETAEFCSHCGASLKQAAGIVCDKCGKTSPPGTKFCAYCGDPFMLCPECGADNPSGAAICVKCGKPMPKECPQCHTLVPGGMKFCANCGCKMVKTCAGCGNEVAPGMKFCANCGTKCE
ncbi:MAG: zinc-ribbon domain-containing protein [Lentisphaerae bacterium]|nr:zinc-ribbon domain-containing protein [Lentisphaerota bacterium]